MSYFNELQANWEEFARTDPLWAILIDPRKKGNKWKLDEFFGTGITEIAELMAYLEDRQIVVPKRRALDFGCGVGRLTQALALYFDVAEGVDISPAMIELANKYNRHGRRCRYHVNDEDLSLFEDRAFDFIYTNLVLQHMKPDYSKKYIEEFLRILTPSGLLVFNLPTKANTEANTEANTIWRKLYALRAQLGPRQMLDKANRVLRKRPVMEWPVMEMHVITKKSIEALLQKNRAKVVDVVTVDEDMNYTWTRYFVVK